MEEERQKHGTDSFSCEDSSLSLLFSSLFTASLSSSRSSNWSERRSNWLESSSSCFSGHWLWLLSQSLSFKASVWSLFHHQQQEACSPVLFSESCSRCQVILLIFYFLGWIFYESSVRHQKVLSSSHCFFMASETFFFWYLFLLTTIICHQTLLSSLVSGGECLFNSLFTSRVAASLVILPLGMLYTFLSPVLLFICPSSSRIIFQMINHVNTWLDCQDNDGVSCCRSRVWWQERLRDNRKEVCFVTLRVKE